MANEDALPIELTEEEVMSLLATFEYIEQRDHGLDEVDSRIVSKLENIFNPRRT